MRYLITALCCLTMFACSEKQPATETPTSTEQTELATQDIAVASPALLDDILAEQPLDVKARYQYRNPKETLNFFGIKPGMKVLEVLPGGGWYSKILLPYLSSDSILLGADYSMDMWPNFDFGTEAFIKERAGWPAQWQVDAAAWAGENGAPALGYTLTTIAAEHHGTLDAVLFIRALHNLSRFETQGQYLTSTLALSNTLLKDGGIVGVVQHQAAETRDDAWADGSRGYLKKSFVIAEFDKAGFDLVSETAINQNPKDVPGDDDIVWRLGPGFYTSGDDEAMKAKYAEIGESNRMTLLFKKRAI